MGTRTTRRTRIFADFCLNGDLFDFFDGCDFFFMQRRKGAKFLCGGYHGHQMNHKNHGSDGGARENPGGVTYL